MKKFYSKQQSLFEEFKTVDVITTSITDDNDVVFGSEKSSADKDIGA